MKKVLQKLPYKVYMTLTRPERFFKKIVLDGSLEESMVKSFLFGLLGGIALLAISLIGMKEITLVGMLVKLIAYPVVAVCILFILAGLMMMFSEITGGNRDWELSVKGISSIFFMYPLILILDALAFNCISLWVISILIDGYILFLLYNVAFHCMKGKKWKVLTLMATAAALLIFLYASKYNIVWLAMKNPAAAISCL